MKALYDDSPIIACCSGLLSNTALAIIRISGFKSLRDLRPFFQKNIEKMNPRNILYTNIVHQSNVIDSAVLTYFEAPKSFTGENVLELAIHGNQLNIQRVIKLFLGHNGIRNANPGEFTYRALKNNKMSLSQVEGLDLLLNASSQYALDQGQDLLSGQLEVEYQDLLESFLALKASVELSIDFLEDVGEQTADEALKLNIQGFAEKVNQLYQRTQVPIKDLAAPEIVLVGAPNAGKSSFFNYLLQKNRALVSHRPGTTRDYIGEPIMFGDVQFRLIDTAGIRATTCDIEEAGIKSSKDLLNKAFFKILVVNPLDFTEESLQEFLRDDFDLILLSHLDQRTQWPDSFLSDFGKLISNAPPALLIALQETGPIGPKEQNEGGPIGPKCTLINLNTSSSGPIGPEFGSNSGALLGIDLFKDLVINKFKKLTSNNPIMLERHCQQLAEIKVSFDHFVSIVASYSDVAVISSELGPIQRQIEELIGIITPDDVMQKIFDNFCIGK